MGLLRDLENSDKEIFDKIFSKIKRAGIENLYTELLKNTDFFTAPASTKYHSSHPGGLCRHSINVYNELERLLTIYPNIECSEETAAIIALLHDICKINFYEVSYRNVRNSSGEWVKEPYYSINEELCYGGHGSKSVYLIQKYIKLTDEEAIAINCHMGTADAGNYSYNVSKAYEKYPLAWLLHVADESATYIVEKK